MGAALIPNKKIYRRNGDKEYYIHFSEDTVRKASQLFLSRGKQNNSTLEHEVELRWFICCRVLDNRRRSTRQVSKVQSQYACRNLDGFCKGKQR